MKPIIAVDIETYDPHLHEWGAGSIRKDGYIIGVGAYSKELSVDAFYRPTDPAIQKILNSEYTKVFHNAVYDLDWLVNGQGLTFAGTIDDTMTRETLLDAYDYSYSLDHCCEKHGVQGKNKADTIDTWWEQHGGKGKAIEHLADIPWHIVGTYCRQDCKATHDLWYAQQPLLESEGLIAANDIESRLYPWLMKTRGIGLPFDWNARDELSDKLNDDLDKAESAFFSQYGQINVNSSMQVAQLFQQLGIRIKEYTDKGGPKLGQDELAEYDHPVAKEIHHIRMLRKLLSTFVDGQFMDLSFNGRQWTTLYPAKRDSSGGTVTGRFSCIGIGSLVYTKERGYIPIEHVEAGMHVLTHKQRYREVRTVRFTGIREVGQVAGVYMTGSHYCLTSKGWEEAQQLKEYTYEQTTGFRVQKDGRGQVSSRGQAYKATSIGRAWSMYALCPRDSDGGYTIRCVGSGKGSSVLPLEAWGEESAVRPDGREEPFIHWGCGQWDRLPNEESEWQILLCTSHSDGRCTWHRCVGDARLGGHTSHRWKQEEQHAGQSSVDDADRTWTHTSRIPRGTWNTVGILPVFDLEVEEDHSFVVEGIIVHNSQSLNSQNIPARGDKFGTEIRSLFIPEDGCLLGAFDYKQIEYRVFMHFAYSIVKGGQHLPEIEGIHDRFEAGENLDYHELVQRMMGWWDDNNPKKTKAFRHVTKNLNFGSIYGLGYRSFAKKFKYPLMGAHPDVEEDQLPMLAKSLQDMYYTKIPFVRPTMDGIMDVVQSRGYVKTVANRRIRLVKDGKVYKTVNYVTQGSAGDIIKKALVDSWESGVWDVLIPHNMVHDEIVFSIPQTKEGYEACLALRDCMVNSYKLNIPLGVDTEIGKDWGHCDGETWDSFVRRFT